MYGKARYGTYLASILLIAIPASADDGGDQPHVSYTDASHSTVLLLVDGKEYLVNVANHSVSDRRDASGAAPSSSAAALFRQNCSGCHGDSGQGIAAAGTPDLTNPAVQRRLTDDEMKKVIHNGKGNMPPWSGKLPDAQIDELVPYVRSLSSAKPSGQSLSTPGPVAEKRFYQPGDDMLMSLPTGRPVDEHGMYFNFTHRFPYDSAVSGSNESLSIGNVLARGQELFGLDNFGLASFGFRYGITDKLSVDIYRSPSFIGRQIELMLAYNLLDEHHGDPLNLAIRFSVDGQDNFRKNYSENIEAIFSRSFTSRVQFYAVPTVSFNDRRLVQGGVDSQDIPDLPGINAFSIGFGLAWDVRKTVALLAEVIPTLVNGDELGIHRPAYSFGIQKKIYRHAFTLGLTNSPGTTVSQRAGTRATFLGSPNADTPAGLFLGFDITRQIH